MPLYLRNHVLEQQLYTRRAHVTWWIFLGLMCILAGRLFILQGHQHDRFTMLSDQNHIAVIPIPPKRGIIYDRNGVILATNRPAFSAVLQRDQLEDWEALVPRLKQLFDLSEEECAQVHSRLQKARSFDEILIKAQLSEEELARYALHKGALQGVKITTELLRHYPHGPLLAHALGYVARISEHDLERIDKANYKGTVYIGKSGLERSYEEVLHGKVGYREAEIDAKGRLVRILHEVLPEPGADLYLSLDVELQKAAAESFEEAKGALVALDPRNGEILAFVSAPSFDPNAFVTGISRSSYQALQNSTKRPLYNRVLLGLYPPASTIKPIFALAGLENHLVDRHHQIFDAGQFQLPGMSRPFRDWKRHGHGWTDLNRALYGSCDTYFYQLAQRLGIEEMHRWMQHFGFGAATGVDLLHEKSGISPHPAWKKKHRKESWYPGETIVTGIGQGYVQTTPLQLAVVAAMFANKGERVVPHLVTKIAHFQGEIEALRYPVRERLTLNDPKNWEAVEEGLVNVIAHPEGTAHYLKSRLHVSLAGKTGTAQQFSLGANQKYDANKLKEHLRDNTLFIGYAPIQKPRIAFSIVVENSKGGPQASVGILNRFEELYDAQDTP